MITVRVRFRINGNPTAKITDSALALIASWRMNGQVVGSYWPLALHDDLVEVFLSVPEASSLTAEIGNEYVASRAVALESLRASPEIEVVGNDPASAKICSCECATAYFLYTTYLCEESPLRCGDCFRPVPLYRIPKTSGGEYWDILSWQSDYKACDTLQMGGSGERYGTRQLYEVNSMLSRQGREVAARIENVSELPTYYYLHKATARSRAAEEKRQCPDCGGHWLLQNQLHDLFDYQCLDCRLVSNIACNLA